MSGLETTGTEYHRFEIGELIAERYELVRNLGAGGMGAVYQVIDQTLDSEVIALKLLYPHLVRDRVILARFRNEVLVARRLAHPNIIRIYDFGQDKDSSAFISMEYIEGVSLASKIYAPVHERYSFSESLKVLLDISEGLAHAHRKNVMHRDLKPDNVLINIAGEPRITDFGLARTLEVDKGFTQSGEAVGTPYYMSPEQLRGDDLDTRCDIYALGIIAFEMVVGHRPFQDESYLALAAMHFKEDIPKFATSSNGIPSWFQELVFICAEKDRKNRFQTMDEVVGFINKHKDNVGSNTVSKPAVSSFANTPVRRSSRHSSKRRFKVLVLLCLLMIGISVPIGMAALLRSNAGAQSVAAGWVLRLEQGLGGAKLRPLRALAGVDLELNDESFIKAITAQQESVVTALLIGGIDPDIEIASGETALHYSIGAELNGIAGLLIDHGADLNRLDSGGYTPLMRAVESNNEVVVNALLERNVNVNTTRTDGSTALLLAAAYNPQNVDQNDLNTNLRIVQSLLDQKARVNLAVKGVGSPLTEAAKAEKRAVVALLAEDGADLNYQDADGRTGLHYAMMAGDEAMILSLVKDSNGIRRSSLDPGIRDLRRKSASDYGSKKARRIFLAALGGSNSQKKKISEKSTITRKGVRLTTLRSIGKPKIEWIPVPSNTQLRLVRVELRNDGEETAKNIQVHFKLPGGKTYRLQGPAELMRKRRSIFKWEEAMSASKLFVKNPTKNVKIQIKCDNCR